MISAFLRTNLLEHGSASTRDRLVSYTILIKQSARPCVDDRIGSSELLRYSVRKCGLQDLGGNESFGPEDELCTGFLVVAEIGVIPVRPLFSGFFLII